MKIRIITSNEGKYREYERRLDGSARVEKSDVEYYEIQSDSLEDVVDHGLEQLEEHHPLIIDDSGLFIDELDGFPGVYSSYVMKTLGCGGILSLMEKKEDRRARFECVIGFIDDKGEKMTFKGISDGVITHERRGSGGFGYDPIFLPSDHRRTYAEMSTEEKNEISHRGKALDRFIGYLKEGRE